MSWNLWAQYALKSNYDQPASDKVWITDRKGNLWGYADKDGNQGEGHCPISPEEFQAVSDMFHLRKSQADGLTVGGVHYIVLRIDGDCIVCKRGTTAGLTIAQTAQCVVFGLYDNCDVTAGNNRLVVEKLGDTLRSNGY